MRTLWDQPRWLKLTTCDDRGSELFEQICELPEYYLTRTEEAILERAAGTLLQQRPWNASSNWEPARRKKPPIY